MAIRLVLASPEPILVYGLEPLFVECVRKVARGERWVELCSEAAALEHMVRRETVMRQLSRQLTARELGPGAGGFRSGP
jgi:hypothetical protein